MTRACAQGSACACTTHMEPFRSQHLLLRKLLSSSLPRLYPCSSAVLVSSQFLHLCFAGIWEQREALLPLPMVLPRAVTRHGKYELLVTQNTHLSDTAFTGQPCTGASSPVFFEEAQSSPATLFFFPSSLSFSRDDMGF